MIFVNQPYIITVNESGQIGSKIELFIWNGATEPSTPTYTFTKLAPSPTDLANYYNISPFIAEFIQFGINETSSFALLGTSYYANYRVKSYKNVAGTYTEVNDITGNAMYGVHKPLQLAGGLLNEGTYNILGGCESGCDSILVTYTLVGEEPVTVEVESSGIANGKLYYSLSINLVNYIIGWNLVGYWRFLILSSTGQARLTEDTECPFGNFTIEEGSIFEAFEVTPLGGFEFVPVTFVTWILATSIRWTDLVNGTIIEEDLATNSAYVVNANRFVGGTKLEFITLGNVGQTWTFIPQCECTYEPVKIQYLNEFGALFTTWFYKASKESFSIENSEFKAFQEVSGVYYSGKQRANYNTIGREKITVNSGWVEEFYNQTIKDILMSEYLLVNDRFALIDTKSIELQKNINNDLINYQLTFNFANDYSR
jgi:hypothetical protein